MPVIHTLITIWTYTAFFNIILPTTGPVVQLQSQAFYSQAACEFDRKTLLNSICPGPGQTQCKLTVGVPSCEETQILHQD